LSDSYYGTGRRKTSTARVFLRPGGGKMVVNGRQANDYFANRVLEMIARQALVLVEKGEDYDVEVSVAGGGIAGQAGAIRHGVARALLTFEPELRPQLKSAGFLTRDSRMKERKKPGQRGARARFQFSKR
jgi:small subunit ribosomal protein S9